MSHKMFLLTNDTGENKIHLVTFQVAHIDREEILCDECYQEWLQGI